MSRTITIDRGAFLESCVRLQKTLIEEQERLQGMSAIPLDPYLETFSNVCKLKGALAVCEAVLETK